MYSIFLPRRLTQDGCVVAGTKLATYYVTLTLPKGKSHPKLPAKVEASIQAVLAKTKAVEALTTTDATMNEIDRGTDRCIAAFSDQLDAIERSFDHVSILPLSEGETARKQAATLVRSTLVPSTDFLRLPYSQQWRRMSAMVKAMGAKDVTAAILELGLGVEAARIQQWVAIYGSKLGVTEAKDTDPAAVTVEAWHEAYGQLMVQAHAEYDDAKDDEQMRLRDSLLAPYLDQVEEERRTEQKARAKKQPAGTAASADPPKSP